MKNIKKKGKIDINKFCNKLVETNLDEDSIKIMNKKPKI